MDSKERRREQNRQAQRRFREKHSKRKPAETSSKYGSSGRDIGGPSGSNMETLSPLSQWPSSAPITSALMDMNTPTTSNLYTHAVVNDDTFWSTNLDFHHTPTIPLGQPRNADDLQLYIDRNLWNGFDGTASNFGSDAASTHTPTSSQDDNSRMSTLHTAVQKGNTRIVRLLLRHGADCNVKNSAGMTPLLQAIERGHEEIADILLCHGAAVEQVDHNNRSALHWAIISRHEQLLKRIVKQCGGKGSLLNGCDKEGRTPLQLAVEVGLDASVELLLEHGADLD